MEKEIEINGLKVLYEETGNPSGSAVILLHGWGCNHNTVKSIASCLSDAMRIINVDLPGHGDTSEPIDVWGSYDFANFVGELIKQLNLKKPSLIGHSFGGRTSIAYGATHEDINKMVLIDAAGITPKRNLKYYYKVYSYKILKKITKLVLGEKRAKIKIESALKKSGSSDYLSASPKMRAIMSKCINEDLRKAMCSIKVPTLLIWGENDTATPLSDARIMEKMIPDCGLVSFPNCGHFSFLDNPVGFRTVIREFFKTELS